MSGKKYLLNQPYFKPNYYKALEHILPQYLKEDDIDTFGKDIDPTDSLINTHIDLINNFSSVLYVSSIATSPSYSAMDTPGGVAPYFVKQNNLTDITTDRFERKILNKLNRSILDFETSGEFATYVSGTLLSSIVLNSPTAQFETAHTAADTHTYLIENLSWVYFLNTSGSGGWDPSSWITNKLVETVYTGNPILINDGIRGLSEFTWRNNLGYYPTDFVSGVGEHVSGTQQLEKLGTWIDVVYSPLYADSADFTVRDKIDTFLESNVKSSDSIPAGPYSRLIRAMSFLAFDINNETEMLGSLYDLEDCPDDFLPHVAELIGWDLFGADPDRWRLQLRNAVDIYKSIGTKKSIQFALNTVFPKDTFPIESRITELYESYVPYLIYYALATESSNFKSFGTWTAVLAESMNVGGFSTSSFDENLRLAVDRILLEVYEEFPDSFNIPNQEKGFYYRGRTYPIPPFEEYPYYVNVEITPRMVEFIADRLACFGVRQQFALDTSGYIESNTLQVDDEPRAGSMLFFTSGHNDPPNLASLITNLNDNKFEYVSLWNGKSSHFKLVFDASEFDFLKTGLDLGDENSRDAFYIASQITNKLAPADAIPLISIELSSIDVLGFEASAVPLIFPDKNEIDPGGSRNTTESGIVIGTYKRGISPSGLVLGRGDANNLHQTSYTGSIDSSTLERNTLRRRSLEKIMPLHSYYDRTGYNMPTSFYMTSSLSGAPLGFIPSSLSYEDITDYVNLPAVYSHCETITSPRSYFGYAVSDALLSRGHVGLGLDSTHNDRGQLAPIYDAIHSIKEREKILEASAAYGPVSGVIDSVSNVYLSEANIRTEASGWFPNSADDFYFNSFGKDLHKLYGIYAQHFNKHALAPHIMELDGATLFSHTWGPILYNNDFEDISYTTNLVVSSLASVPQLTPESSIFSGPLSYVASAATDMYLDTYEKVVSGLVDGVELIHTSGSYSTNSFSVFRLGQANKTLKDDPYMFENTFIASRATGNGLPRIRFDMGKYNSPASRPIQDQFLIPNHKFKCKTKCLVTDNKGLIFGGSNRQVGVWVHTKPENGLMWTVKDGVWFQHSQLLSRTDILTGYSHIFKLERKTKEEQRNEPKESNLQCLDLVTGTTEPTSPVSKLRESDFETLEFEFNTINKFTTLPKAYRDTQPALHRTNQEYVVEVFLIPNGLPDEFLLLDTVELQDTTMKKLSEKYVTGGYVDPLCHRDDRPTYSCENRVELTKEELFDIFRYFNSISNTGNLNFGKATRDISNADTMGAGGGSRIDYRLRATGLDTLILSGTYNLAYDEIEFLG